MSVDRGLSLEGDVAIITGGAQGIGEATSRLFAERGARVVVADRNGPRADEVASDIRELGFKAVSFTVDVTDTAQLDSLIGIADANFGGLNHLVNNAGVAIDRSLAKQADADFEKTIAINLIAGRNLAKRAINYMIDGDFRGTISNASSTTAEFGLFSQTAYGASKGGIETLTKALAREVGQKGIRVNAVAPGPVQTPMLGQLDEEGHKQMAAQTALNRLAVAREIAGVYAFLASDEASYITGAVIKVDGGFKKG